MEKLKLVFHYVSYLQYPFLAIALFSTLPIIQEWSTLKEDPKNYIELVIGVYSNFLFYFGISMSFSTLQDTTKTQNTFSRKIWESPRKGKITIIGMGALVAIFLISGLFFIWYHATESLKELGVGLTTFGVGMIGMMKAAAEMHVNFRKG